MMTVHETEGKTRGIITNSHNLTNLETDMEGKSYRKGLTLYDVINVMESSNMKYRIWAIGIYLFTTNTKGISSMKLHRELTA